MTEVDELRRQNAELRDRLSKLLDSNAKLTEQVAKLTDRVTELLAIARRRVRKPSPEKPPAPRPELTGDAKRAFEERPTPPERPARAKPEKKQVEPTGRKPLPQHLEADEHRLRAELCVHCGSSALDSADELVEEKLHVVKEHQRRRVVRRTTCRCRDCGGRTTPRSLPAPYERSKVTGDWLAWFVHNKFALLTPLDRIRRDLAERGVPLAMGTLVGQLDAGFLAIWRPRGRGRHDRAEGLLSVPSWCSKKECDCTIAYLACVHIDDRLAWAKHDQKGLSFSWRAPHDRPPVEVHHLRLDLVTGQVQGLRQAAIPEPFAPYFAQGLPAWILDDLFEQWRQTRPGLAPDLWLDQALEDWRPGEMLSELEAFPEMRPEEFVIGGKTYAVDFVFCVAESCACTGHRFVVFEVDGRNWRQIAAAELTDQQALGSREGDRAALDAVHAAWTQRVVHPKDRFDEARARVRERGARLHAAWRARAPKPATPKPPPSFTDDARPKPGRNDACPCGSGRKYKRCHGS